MKRNTGFTLIELMLALALSVVVAGILAESLSTAFHAKKSIEEALEATRATDIAVDTIRDELANCLPPSPATATTIQLDSTGNSTPNSILGAFVGVDNMVNFYTAGPEPRADLQPDVREVQYALVPDTEAEGGGGGQMLVRRVWTNVLATEKTQPPDEVVCRNVLNFTLSYYDGTDSYDAWDSRQQNNALPVAVQVTLELAPSQANGKSRLDTRIIPIACGLPAASTTGGN